MNNKKVFFLFPRFGIGGISKALSFVANTCAENGFQVYCISMSTEEQTILLHDSIKKIYCPYILSNNILLNSYVKLQYIWKLRRLIKEIMPDMIIGFGTDLIRIVCIAASPFKIPIVGSERGNPYVYTKAQSQKYIKYLSKCDFVVFQTEGAKKYYPQTIQKKSVIIPNPAVQRFDKEFVVSNKRSNHIIVCSRLSSEKRIIDIIKAYSMSANLKREMVLHIYGSGPEEVSIKKFVLNNNLEDLVILKGNVQNVFEIESTAALFVLYSEFEGMPNSLIEAMGMGIPCVASDCPPGGVSFVADSGRRAKLVGMNSVEELSKAMEEVCLNPEVSARYSFKAREINEVLNPIAIKDKWINLIHKILYEEGEL